MTDDEKQKIRTYRESGHTYKEIAENLGISLGSVKVYCSRNKIMVKRSQGNAITPDSVCENCGLPVMQTPGRKKKRFCSDACRNRWWNEHTDKVNRKAVYSFECGCCGRKFESYGNAGRKYCSHECYIKDRFGGREL